MKRFDGNNPTLLDAAEEARRVLTRLSKLTIHENDTELVDALITLDLAISTPFPKRKHG